MNVEALQTRIKELMDNRETMIANVNAINGAIQDCEFWLAELEESVDEEQEEE